MANYNKVTLVGHLTREPETKTVKNTSVTDIAMAVNESWKDKATGEWKEKTCYVDLQAWGDRGEAIASKFAKGAHVLVEGRLQQDRWESEDGKRSKHYVSIDRFISLDKAENQAEAPSPPKPDKADNDVPF